MYTTVREGLDVFMRYVGEEGDARARQIALDCLNAAYQDVSTAHPWKDQTSSAPLSLTLTPGRSRYSAPSHVSRILDPVRNLTHPGQPLEGISAATAAMLYPETGTTNVPRGCPRHFTIVGISGTLRHPNPEGEPLEVLSDDAADTNVTLTISGDDANGEKRERSYTLAGTAPIAVGTWSYVDAFAKAIVDGETPATAGTSSRGTVSLRVVSSGLVLQALDPQESAREHKVIQFYPTPDAADVLLLPFVQRPRRLVEGSDPLPGDWWPALFEAMLLHHRVNTGEIRLTDLARIPKPALKRLIEDDNCLRERPRVRPFSL